MLHFNTLVVVQIITESFPISSSGHLMLIQCIGNFFSCLNVSKIYLLSSDIVTYFIHMPTVIVVAVFFYKKWWSLIFNWRRMWPIIIKLIVFTWIVDVMTATIFLLARKTVFTFPLYIGFACTALVLFSLRYCPTSIQSRSCTFFLALVLGIVQGAAFLPGVSRFAVVYTALRWWRFTPQKAFTITWMVHWPLIFAAASLSSGLMIINPTLGDFITRSLLLNMGIAAIGAIAGLYMMYYLACSYRLWLISIYMIVPTLLAYFMC